MSSPPCDFALQFHLPRNRDSCYRLSGIEFRVEFGEALALERHGGLLLDWAALEAAQALQHILPPDDRFAELAVAYDIDARLRPLASRVIN